MKTPEQIQAGFRQQALEPEDPNWPEDIHTELLADFLKQNLPHDKPLNILDVGSGKARVSACLKKHIPNAAFTGADFVQESLNVALAKNRIDHAIQIDLGKPSNALPSSHYDFAFSTRATFFFSPEELLEMLRTASNALKPGAYFLCQHFLVTDSHTPEFVNSFKKQRTQYRSLERLDDLIALYSKTGWDIDTARTNASLAKNAHEHFPNILIYAENKNK